MSRNTHLSRSIITLVRIFRMTVLVFVALTSGAFAQDRSSGDYLIQPGDILRVSVWKEPDLQQELLVRPDGKLSFPLMGEAVAGGRTVNELQDEITSKIKEYIPEPVVTVQILKTEGNTIFVLGKVNRPGVYVMTRPFDVTQALALAGGMATFAEEEKISILRRTETGQTTMSFDFDDVQYGKALEQNILLQPGDVVIVP